MQGIYPAKTEKGIGSVTTIWYDGIPDPIWKSSRSNRLHCEKYIPKPEINNWILTAKEVENAADGDIWGSFACSFKQGQFVNKTIVLPFMAPHLGKHLPGKLFSTGWYKMQVKFFDQFDEKFLCMEIRAYFKI